MQYLLLSCSKTKSEQIHNMKLSTYFNSVKYLETSKKQ